VLAGTVGFEIGAFAPHLQDAAVHLDAELVSAFAPNFPMNVIIFVLIEPHETGESVLLPAVPDNTGKVIGESCCDIHADLSGVNGRRNPILTIR